MKILAKLIETLKKRRLSVALAESCTGGYASFLMTKIPGSSKVFKAGLIVYSNEAKNKLLNIPLSLSKKNQGVSKEIAEILAKNVRKKFNTTIGASIVGFAGPKTQKGVKTGTVFIAISDKKSTISTKTIIKGNRDTIRKKASHLLINLIYQNVVGNRPACSSNL